MNHVRLPTSKVALVLLGLCRQGDPPQELEDQGDGKMWFTWRGLRDGAGSVGIDRNDAEAFAGLQRASTCTRGYVELAAILTCVLMLANAPGGWRLERVAALVYGPRTPASHRARQLPGIKALIALLERGWFQIEVPAAKPARGERKRSKPAGEVIRGSLLSVEGGEGRGERTLRPSAPFLAALSSFAVEVPADFFRLPEGGHHNPEGNRPSLAMRARLRLAAAIVARWRRANPQAMRTDELLRDFAGVDVERIERRRHVREWVEEAWVVLGRAKATGPGLERARPSAERPGDNDERPLLRTLLRLVLPQARGSATRPAVTPGGATAPRSGEARQLRQSRAPT